MEVTYSFDVIRIAWIGSPVSTTVVPAPASHRGRTETPVRGRRRGKGQSSSSVGRWSRRSIDKVRTIKFTRTEVGFRLKTINGSRYPF